MPIEPPACPWQFPPASAAGAEDLLASGADLEPGTVLAAYRRGIFPMPVGSRRVMWWSPAQRGILPVDGLHQSRSLRRSCRRFEIRVDSAFDPVLAACADPGRSGGWITTELRTAYRRLHELGWVHSVEAWDGDGLAGGLYGVSVGGLFAGESMFHRRPDASKVALVALVERLCAAGPQGRLIDVQWATPHLRRLGAVEVPRAEYLSRLDVALRLPAPPWPERVGAALAEAAD
jgi:leucyl/phenylalanyl-tRNA---protein transferase